MQTRRSEALRRLGGPVCPICHAVGGEIEVRFITNDGSDWLKSKGKGHIEQARAAPMCTSCFTTMENSIVATRAARAERQAEADVKRAEDAARLGRMSGAEYRAGCAEHEDDLAAVEQMVAGWDVGNGLFGSRGE